MLTLYIVIAILVFIAVLVRRAVEEIHFGYLVDTGTIFDMIGFALFCAVFWPGILILITITLTFIGTAKLMAIALNTIIKHKQTS